MQCLYYTQNNDQRLTKGQKAVVQKASKHTHNWQLNLEAHRKWQNPFLVMEYIL